MAELRFTKDHEWIRVEDGDVYAVGISDYAQSQLGDVVFVELPAVGRGVTRGGDAAVVESVKAAADVYMPVDGEITEVNEALRADPSLANSDPMGAGWFFKVKLSDASQLGALMDETAYARFSAES